MPERTALLVEDDLLVRQIVQQGLRRAGWTVVAVDSAEIALDLLKKTHFRLMISDIAMQGMDGFELTRSALGCQPDLPVVLTSGYEYGGALVGILLAPQVAFLGKPFLNSELLAVVARISGENASKRCLSVYRAVTTWPAD